ncbi:VOC family protein [Lacticaseibacillus pabuli]|uniref:VOC family protein n=1 Tax=Lacticaseibacillus pabuli TaxID=3025672 RepID=A0ABY7WU17_9LACO|nr:VOC family protein [Lacticaseibacillus sp. KACC 23028]WDF83284.1 VOC family protein [Lacticaseibacillus sp. KACC 23028]
MQIESIDHIVLTVANINRTVAFYHDVLGMEITNFAEGRTALCFGDMKINLHERGHEFEPKANHPTPGSGDFCLLTKTPLEEVMATLNEHAVAVEVGPITKHGALGDLRSVYVRDPDQNLVEISNQLSRD